MELLFNYKIKGSFKRFVDVIYSITEFKRKVNRNDFSKIRHPRKEQKCKIAAISSVVGGPRGIFEN